MPNKPQSSGPGKSARVTLPVRVVVSVRYELLRSTILGQASSKTAAIRVAREAGWRVSGRGCRAWTTRRVREWLVAVRPPLRRVTCYDERDRRKMYDPRIDA